ncbi:MAG TPA: Gfo/Idh/MocA family oxidoreductase [Caulobacteraceae bacterium]|jgi:predicted dehydrogenase|nr:Gfo/Idh/MocA family oxidoreductase [Caulobacteraceae bacterium]
MINASSPLRIGLLAASKIAVTAVIAPAKAREDVVVTAVAARDPARARAYADSHGIEAVAEDYAALIARDDVDVVYVGSPIANHAEWTIRAAEAGKAVLCEKAFALNAGEARAMVAAANAADRPLLEAFHYRFHNVIRRAEAIVRSGELGRLTRADASFEAVIPYSPDEIRWRADQGGGALGDLGSYPAHALRTLVGAEPEVTSAKIEMWEGVDAATAAELRFPGDLAASLRCSMVAERFDASLTLTGERGQLSIRNFIGPQMGCSFRVRIGDESRSEPTDGPTTYAAQLEHLVEVMGEGTTPLTGGADAIANLELMDAIRAAA